MEVFLCGRVLLCVYFLYSVHNGHTLIDEVDGTVVGVERIHLHTDAVGGMMNADIAAEEEPEGRNEIAIAIQISKFGREGSIIQYTGGCLYSTVLIGIIYRIVSLRKDIGRIQLFKEETYLRKRIRSLIAY